MFRGTQTVTVHRSFIANGFQDLQTVIEKYQKRCKTKQINVSGDANGYGSSDPSSQMIAQDSQYAMLQT